MRRLLPHLALLLVLVAPFQTRAQIEAPTPIEEVDPGASELLPPPLKEEETGDVPADAAPEESEEEAEEAPILPPPLPAVTPKRAPEPKQAPPPDPRGLPRVTPPPSAVRGEPLPGEPVPTARPAKGEKKAEAEAAAGQKEEPEAAPATAPVAEALPPIRVTQAKDEDLTAAWERFREASSALDRPAAEKAMKELLRLKRELGASDLEGFSVAAARIAKERAEANDSVGSIELATAATQLSPGLPWAHFALARAYFASDPTDVGRIAASLGRTLQALAKDPRYLRPAAGDLAVALLTALLATAAAVVVVLFVRRFRFFLHDFHHLFPRAAARWQTVPLAVLLLSLPVVFRLGYVPVLLVLFASVTLYLSWKERIVGAVCLALAGLVPLFAQEVAARTAFPGTRAELLYRLERGGLEAQDVAPLVRARAQLGQAEFAELFVLGRYDLRRGRLDSAAELFRKAALIRGDDARLLVNLGNARLGMNDLDGAAGHYARAAEVDPGLPAAAWNISLVHYRKAQGMADAARALELERAQSAQALAQQMEPALLARAEPPKDAGLNALVLSPGLSPEDLRAHAAGRSLGERVADQLSFRMMGMTSTPLSLLLPALLALAALGLGALAGALSTSRECDRCGRPVCRRCDKDLFAGSSLCSQCVNVFARKGAVAPQVKVRKQIEVDRFASRRERLSWLLGILCSGAGHVFWGLPIRGAVFSFLFLFAVFLGVFRDGVLRAPYGQLPLWLRLVPAAAVLLVVYLLSLRSLRKAQAD